MGRLLLNRRGLRRWVLCGALAALLAACGGVEDEGEFEETLPETVTTQDALERRCAYVGKTVQGTFCRSGRVYEFGVKRYKCTDGTVERRYYQTRTQITC